MPTRKLKSGRIQARKWDQTKGTYRSLGTFATQAEAEKVAARADLLEEMGLVQERTPTKAAPVARGREKFARYAERKLNLKKHTLKRSTYHQYTFLLQAHLNPCFGEMAVADIRIEDVETWWASLADNPHGRRAAYGLFVQFMRKAVKERLIAHTPRTIEKAAKDPSQKRPTFTTGDFRMLEAIEVDPQTLASLWLLVGTGIRVGEMLALDWQDVDLVAETIDVHRHFGPCGMEEGTKSHPNGRRVLAMPHQTVVALGSLQKARRPLPTDPVFVNAREQRLSYHAWNARFAALKKACGLEAMHAHDLRHVHLSEFAQHSTLAEVMARAGHTDHRSALRYQHVDPERQRQIVAQLTF